MPHLLSETLVWCVTLLLFGMGLIGTLIPMLPGIMIIAAGCVWQGVMGRENLAWWEWTVLALMVAGAGWYVARYERRLRALRNPPSHRHPS